MADEVTADERERLVERIITAEQDERRRLALFLHDGPVQSLAGIALMLDAAVQSIDEGKPEVARGIMASALERHRETIRSLRDLSRSRSRSMSSSPRNSARRSRSGSTRSSASR
jgi:signal transduction histidine kinase